MAPNDEVKQLCIRKQMDTKLNELAIRVKIYVKVVYTFELEYKLWL